MPNDSKKKINKFVCQEETLNITCPNNSVIVFDDANFGRGQSDNQRCSHYLGYEGSACDNHIQTLEVLNVRCHELQQCILCVDKMTFGNPCTIITEYLDVTYFCKRKVNQGENTTTSLLKDDENSGQPTKETEHGVQNDVDSNRAELTVIGIVLGVVLALIFLLIGTLMFKRFRQSKQRKGIARTEEIEMNVESENQNQYDYSEVTAQSMGNNANQTSDIPNRLHQAENEYDVSAHVPSKAESEPLTYDVTVSDNTYNVTETSGNEPKDDLNNTYDHFLGEQTEDQYDIADNKVMAATKCKTNEDLYS
ncbi:unnamed protein product [Mytilus edulis]|uniref:SUEL-type lectin domain-containing protein n=1 Tax=Mytilus edulis TaxID=6550 RepID=A0A8S3UJW4_MYTED|nr:unnamed protein product [Mytilus edulis]